MKKQVIIVDYGMGNLFSVRKVVERLGFECSVTSHFEDILNAAKIILPGVGHFGKAMDNLRKADLVNPLNEAVLQKKIPVMGICLGMQLMATHSEEGDVAGLNWMAAEVVRFNIQNKEVLKIPHMGWNRITREKPTSSVLNNISVEDEFYFVHSYHMVNSDQCDVLTKTNYEYSFTSSVEKGHIVGFQFHPEKSHIAGRQLIKNFLST